MIFKLHPAIRAVIGAVLLVIGLVAHRVVFDIAGPAVMAISAYQWTSRRGIRK